MSISVLLPVYNAENTLPEAIESILGQTEQDWELLVVDDGSSDRSPDIIRRYADRDDRVKPLFRPRAGIVAALNFGLEQAGGSYIARMDADDISLPDRLEKQRRFLDTHPDIGLTACLVEHLGDKQRKAGYARYVRWINTQVRPEAIALNRFIESPLAHPSVMFRRQLVQDFGGYRDGPFPEDYELWLRWLEADVKMEKVPETLLQWRDEPGRLSRTHERYSMRAFYRTKAKYLSRWLKDHNPHHPQVIIWGAGRTTRKRADMLTEYGVEITHYVDIDPNKIGHVIHGRTVLSPEEVPDPGQAFIVGYVGSHGANAIIRQHLQQKGYRLGTDYIFAA